MGFSGLTAIEKALNANDEIVFGFRPESAYISEAGKLSGRVYAVEMTGAYNILHIDLMEDEIVHIRTDRSIDYPIGTQVRFDVDERARAVRARIHPRPARTARGAHPAPETRDPPHGR